MMLLSKKRFIKNKQPIYIAVAFFIYITAAVFIFVFAANTGPVMAHNSSVLKSLPNITTPDIKKDFTVTEVDNSKLYTGPLVLVNNHYSCRFDGENLVSVLSNADKSYTASDYDVKVNKIAMNALNSMMKDFYSNTQNKNVMVSSAYRSKELQQELYDEDKSNANADSKKVGEEFVAIPGYSEHQTGYAVDLSVLNDGIISVFDNKGDYSWVLENCSNYGFVLRYPEDKTAITEIGHETWHYRYVGTPHAAYMAQNNLCLEEYIEQVKSYSINNPLYITDNSLNSWMVYFVKAENGSKTSVTVPRDCEYQINGNNNDGFVISVQLN